MNARLAFLASLPELAETARRVAEESNEDMIIVEGAESYLEAYKLQQQGVEAIIARGPTVELARQRTTIPVIRCDPSAFDLLKAFSEAKRLDNHIGLITSWNILFDKKLVEDLLGITLYISRTCLCSDDVYREVKLAADYGLRVVVGGTITAEAAPSLGLACIKLYTSKEAIRESLEKAKETIRIAREKQAEAERMKIILDLEQTGIMSIDAQGVVNVFNPMAEEIMGIKKNDIIGKSVAVFFPHRPGLKNITSATGIHGDIVTFGKVTAVNNRIPILVNGRVEGLVSTYQEVTRLQEIEAKVRTQLHKKGFTAKAPIEKLMGESKKIKEVALAATEYARSDLTILIMGETGTGKGLLAQGIHLASHRAEGPFVAVNCSALPETLLESELFGYEEGAFTGARRKGKQGLFELAHKGTIFLDEIAGTSLNMQSRLLKVVEEKEVMRVGGNQVIPLDVRILAASNRDLRKAGAEGSFRLDLFYRLNVLSLKMPSLRERPEDVLLLYRYFLRSMNIASVEIENILDPELSDELCNYYWPGNIRELEHLAEKTAALSRRIGSSPERVKKILLEEIRESQEIVSSAGRGGEISVRVGALADMESQIIAKLYRKCYGNKRQLAAQLGISRTTLWKKLDHILDDKLLKEMDGD